MSFYLDMSNIATQLLKQFDQGGLSLDVYSSSGGTAWEPGTTTYTPQPFTGTAQGVKAQELIDGLIVSTDLAVTMPGTLAPKMDDRITINGKAYSILKIDAKPSAGIVAAYKVYVRA